MKSPPDGGGHLARVCAAPSGPRAYAISKRTLRPDTAAVDMVTTVWGPDGRVSTCGAARFGQRRYGRRLRAGGRSAGERGKHAQAIVRGCLGAGDHRCRTDRVV